MSGVINYPIKYAILELKKTGGWADRYETITQGFIVSKCYVVESSITYHFNGNNKIAHKVVFPFENLLCLEESLMNGKQNIGEPNISSYDACNRPSLINIVKTITS